ncbi:MAG TPA: hypothetical protein VH000_07270 [Rhizomicrobium sp.]|jgi:Ca2+-binding EF-hand superfamily protein|nr:hypothetical protein [Rhizomicrobium sp.]
MKTKLAACAGIAMFVATAATAAATLDANGDGQVTKAELTNYVKAQQPFSAIDANGDGAIDANEWAASSYTRQMAAGRLNDASRLSPADYMIQQESDAAFRFGKCDLNHDGTLTGSEIGCSIIGIPIN